MQFKCNDVRLIILMIITLNCPILIVECKLKLTQSDALLAIADVAQVAGAFERAAAHHGAGGLPVAVVVAAVTQVLR